MSVSNSATVTVFGKRSAARPWTTASGQAAGRAIQSSASSRRTSSRPQATRARTGGDAMIDAPGEIKCRGAGKVGASLNRTLPDHLDQQFADVLVGRPIPPQLSIVGASSGWESLRSSSSGCSNRASCPGRMRRRTLGRVSARAEAQGFGIAQREKCFRFRLISLATHSIVPSAAKRRSRASRETLLYAVPRPKQQPKQRFRGHPFSRSTFRRWAARYSWTERW
jgi:hypothetical protein